MRGAVESGPTRQHIYRFCGKRLGLGPRCYATLWTIGILVALGLQAVYAAGSKAGCDYDNRFCGLKSRFGFGATVLNNKVFYHGGLDANNPTSPITDSVFEMVDLDTLMPYTLPLFPDPSLNSSRYNHLLATWGDKLLAVGGAVDDKNGQTQQALSVISTVFNTRRWNLTRQFRQDVEVDIVFDFARAEAGTLSLVTSEVFLGPADVRTQSQRVVRYLDLASGEITQLAVPPMSQNLGFLDFNLVSLSPSLGGDGLPPYLMVEARRQIQTAGGKDPLGDDIIFSVAAEEMGKPLPLTLRDSAGLLKPNGKGTGGNTLRAELIKANDEIMNTSLVLWSKAAATFARLGSSALVQDVSVVSVHTVIARFDPDRGEFLGVTLVLRHTFVAPPPGWTLDQLQQLDLPMYGQMAVTKALKEARLVVGMPYVGEVDKIGTIDLRTVAITETEAGFVVRGNALPSYTCTQNLGYQPFILNFKLDLRASLEDPASLVAPTVRGGSFYSTCPGASKLNLQNPLKQILETSMNTYAGTGIYGFSSPAGPRFLVWSPEPRNVHGFFAEYEPSGTGQAVVLDLLAGTWAPQNISLPKSYSYPTNMATCVLEPKEGAPLLYLEYGGLPLATKGTMHQPPVSMVSAMQLREGKLTMVEVSGSRALPPRAAAAMACAPGGVAYVFGGLQGKAGADAAAHAPSYTPTNTLHRVEVSGSGSSYSLAAKLLQPAAGPVPEPRSGHVLMYLPPGAVEGLGMKQGALLLHGGSNLNQTMLIREEVGTVGFREWFRVYNATWLYDLDANRWQQLETDGEPPALMWHAAALNQQQRGSESPSGAQPMLFGGLSFDQSTGTFNRHHTLQLLDLNQGVVRWRVVDLDMGRENANKLAYPNAAVSVFPQDGLMVLRLEKNVTVMPALKVRTFEGTSDQILQNWGLQTLDLTQGDVVKLAPKGGKLELQEPLLLFSGITVVGAAPAGAAGGGTGEPGARGFVRAGGPQGGRRLHQQRPSRPLMVSCGSKGVEAINIASSSVLENVLISGCSSASAVRVLGPADSGSFTPALLRRVAIVGNSGVKGSAVLMERETQLIMEECLLLGNKAEHSIIYAPPTTRLTLRSCRVANNAGASAVYFQGVLLAVADSVYANNSAALGGAIFLGQENLIYATHTNITRARITNSTFSGNVATGASKQAVEAAAPGPNLMSLGGAIFMGPKSVLQAKRLLFSGNRAVGEDGQGGAVYGADGSCLENADSVEFKGNYASLRGGAVRLKAPVCVEVPRMQFSNLQFTSNAAGGDGGGMYLSEMSSNGLVATNLTFTSNMAAGISSLGDGGGVYLGIWSSVVLFNNTAFRNNSARSSGGGLHALAVLSDLSLVDTQAADNVAGLADPTQGMSVAAADAQARAAGGAVAMVGSQSSLQLQGGSFTGNDAGQGGAVAQLAEGGSSLSISCGTIFRNNVAKNMGGAVSTGPGVRTRVSDTLFEANVAWASNAAGGALYCLQNSHISLSNSSFISNHALFGGGAALLQPASPSEIASCQFTGNTALMRSIAEAQQISFLREGSEAWDVGARDKALFGFDNTTNDAGSYYGGGGLYLSLVNAFRISGSSTFRNNTGINGGGMIARTDLCSAQSETCALTLETIPGLEPFLNNSASGGAGGGVLVTNLTRIRGSLFACKREQGPWTQTCMEGFVRNRRRLSGQQHAGAEQGNRADRGYGNDLATAAAMMVLVSNRTRECRDGQEDLHLPPAEPVSIAPGQPLERMFLLKDAVGHCVRGSISDANMGLQAVLLDPGTGSVIPEVAMLGNTTSASNGTANFNSLQVYGQPGNYVLEFRPYPASLMLAPARLNLTLRECTAGEVTLNQGVQGVKFQCLKCDVGTYSFNPDYPVVPGILRSCRSCEPSAHALCNGSAKVPDSGFWHSHPRSEQVHRCISLHGCLRSYNQQQQLATLVNDHKHYSTSGITQSWVGDEYMSQMCSPGYAGPFCGSCTAGYGRQGFRCVRCGRGTTVVLYLLLCLYMFCLVLLAGVMHSKQVQRRHVSLARAINSALCQTHRRLEKQAPDGCRWGSCSRPPVEEIPAEGFRVPDPDPQDPAFQPVPEPSLSYGGLGIAGLTGTTPYEPDATAPSLDPYYLDQADATAAVGAGGSLFTNGSVSRASSACSFEIDHSYVQQPQWSHGTAAVTSHSPFVPSMEEYTASKKATMDDTKPQGDRSASRASSAFSTIEPGRSFMQESDSSLGTAAVTSLSPFVPSQEEYTASLKAEGEKLKAQGGSQGVSEGAGEGPLTSQAAAVADVGVCAGGSGPRSGQVQGVTAAACATAAASPAPLQGSNSTAPARRHGPQQQQSVPPSGSGHASSAVGSPSQLPSSGSVTTKLVVKPKRQALMDRVFSVESLDESDSMPVIDTQLSKAADLACLPEEEQVATMSEIMAAAAAGRPGAAPGGGQAISLRVSKFFVSDILKVLMSHLQMLGVLRLLGLSWPAAVEGMLTYTDQSLPIVSWMSLDCMMAEAGPLRRSIKRVVMQLLLPAVALVVMAAFWCCFHLWSRLRRQRQHKDWRTWYRPRIIMSLVLILFYLYPAICNVLVSLFAFTPGDRPSGDAAADAALQAQGRHWPQDTLQPYMKGPHLVLLLVLGIPGLLAYALGFPIGLALLLRSNKHKLWVSKEVELQYGFLYDSYHIKFYYWESIFLLEKLLLVVCVTMLAQFSQALQVLVAMALITLAAVLQITFQPFCCKMLDTLQRASFYTLQVTLFLLMIITLSDNPGFLVKSVDMRQAGEVKLAVLIIICTINLLLVLLFLGCLYRETKRMLCFSLGRDPGQLTLRDVLQLVKASLVACIKGGGPRSGRSLGSVHPHPVCGSDKYEAASVGKGQDKQEPGSKQQVQLTQQGSVGQV